MGLRVRFVTSVLSGRHTRLFDGAGLNKCGITPYHMLALEGV